MLDQSRKEAEYCMENAFATYLVKSYLFIVFLSLCNDNLILRNELKITFFI